MTITRLTRRVKPLAALVATTLIPLAAATSPAAASTQDHTSYAFTANFDETHNCGFRLDWQARISGTTTDHYDADGNLVLSIGHAREQDSVTGPGGTLVGDEYNSNLILRFNDAGDIIGGQFTGHFEKIRLPDGSLFNTGGWSDATTFQGGLVAQHGTPADVGRLCDVLGPQ
jgi:hypothetical protein